MGDSAPILAILDPVLKAGQPALRKAAQLSAALARPLRVVVNGYSSAMARAVGLDSARRQAAEQQIRHAWHQRMETLLEGQPADLEVLWDKDSMAALRMEIGRVPPSLIVVRTNDEGRLRRHMFTPRDWQLIRKAPCPVLCVHDDDWASTPKVLAAVDPGTGDAEDDRLSARVVTEGRRVCGALKGAIQIGHVLEDMQETLVLLAGETIPDYAGSMEKVREFHRDNFRQFSAAQGFDVEQEVLLDGAVAPTLAAYCDDNDVDILVVGTVKRNLPERLLLGATAESVLTRAGADLLVIKPEDFRSPWLASEK
ncbi:universal stress protein [Alcanivorax hongdengensis A-11-3]|uniref:Universal stress protein n=1 Tax=Alcanivorax hongdengensis A-11-3 TaxID=1177179 RepID=L0WE14_9GAMM|nr:universal stress protein [Alcanivorax hongdengensis]EKF74045.1 universal stress protein [Alcanivorax hongdengensis A-11-3]